MALKHAVFTHGVLTQMAPNILVIVMAISEPPAGHHHHKLSSKLELRRSQ